MSVKKRWSSALSSFSAMLSVQMLIQNFNWLESRSTESNPDYYFSPEMSTDVLRVFAFIRRNPEPCAILIQSCLSSCKLQTVVGLNTRYGSAKDPLAFNMSVLRLTLKAFNRINCNSDVWEEYNGGF